MMNNTPKNPNFNPDFYEQLKNEKPVKKEEYKVIKTNFGHKLVRV